VCVKKNKKNTLENVIESLMHLIFPCTDFPEAHKPFILTFYTCMYIPGPRQWAPPCCEPWYHPTFCRSAPSPRCWAYCHPFPEADCYKLETPTVKDVKQWVTMFTFIVIENEKKIELPSLNYHS